MAEFQFLDKRVQKTKIELFLTFFTLLEQMPYKDITIQSILEHSNVGRATFYKHYTNKKNLAEDCIELLLKEFTIAYRTPYMGKSKFEFNQLTSDEPFAALLHIAKYHNFYLALMTPSLELRFKEKLLQHLVTLYEQDFYFHENAHLTSYINRYIVYGSAGLIIDWIEQGCPLSAVQFSKILIDTITAQVPTVTIKRRIVEKETQRQKGFLEH
ncbi:TetR/AcrR family transcriptional regulator [Psychrobacillus sp. FJAT-21963]|uniref:TetR/AcrR family transcriptional regulator n=1 Tax=Psychrobacillus sp. FJAT-21963 TaxID=1712028 RepID=UPI0006F91BD4|nr:TetR/AcrR family transcriptional regulator [Psychrobacillus sp. FJAT-21963]